MTLMMQILSLITELLAVAQATRIKIGMQKILMKMIIVMMI